MFIHRLSLAALCVLLASSSRLPPANASGDDEFLSSRRESSRERINRYAQVEQQMFFLNDPAFVLLEDPSIDPVPINNIWWFCPPRVIQANPDDQEEINHVMSHALIYRVQEDVDEQLAAGATGAAELSPHGYLATWDSVTGQHTETLVDFDDISVLNFRNDAFSAMETSLPGQRSGLVLAGSGIWAFDPTSDDRLLGMRRALGMDLTPENCRKAYQEQWNRANTLSDDETDNHSGTEQPRAEASYYMIKGQSRTTNSEWCWTLSDQSPRAGTHIVLERGQVCRRENDRNVFRIDFSGDRFTIAPKLAEEMAIGVREDPDASNFDGRAWLRVERPEMMPSGSQTFSQDDGTGFLILNNSQVTIITSEGTSPGRGDAVLLKRKARATVADRIISWELVPM